jgi:2-methylcitrate dehydratase PrpD
LGKTHGFYHAFAWKSKPRLEELDTLGNPWDAEVMGLLIKIYPCCHGMHSAIDATFALVKEHNISPKDIKEVGIYTNAASHSPMISKDYVEGGTLQEYYGPPKQLVTVLPKTSTEARFCPEYCVARAILDGKVNLEQFTDGKVEDPVIQDFITKKVRMYHDGEVEKFMQEGFIKKEVRMPNLVKIKLNDGREVEKFDPCYVNVGHPIKPVPIEKLEDKIKECAREGGFPDKNVGPIREIIGELEKADDLTELLDLIQPL